MCLKTALALPHGYVGMMGSRSKVAATRKMLAEKGFDTEAIDSVHSPDRPEDRGRDSGGDRRVHCGGAHPVPPYAGAGGSAHPDGHRRTGEMPSRQVTLINCEGSTPRERGSQNAGVPGRLHRRGGISEASAKRDARARWRMRAVIGHYALNSTGGRGLRQKSRSYLIIPHSKRFFYTVTQVEECDR